MKKLYIAFTIGSFFKYPIPPLGEKWPFRSTEKGKSQPGLII